jgi:hypothetical protein
MKTQVITLTPQLAKELLAKNKNNRAVNRNTMLSYAHQMKKGKWKLNGETISIDIDGNVLNGQHRCYAVIESNTSIEVILVTGLPRSVFDTIDTGRCRLHSDVLTIAGVKNATTLGAALKKYYMLQNNYTYLIQSATSIKLSNADVLAMYNERPNYYDELHQYGAQHYLHNFQTLSRSDVMAFFAFFNDKYDTKIVDSFFDAYLEKKGVPGMLFEKLLTDKISKKKMIASEKTKLIIKAFAFFVRNKMVSRLTVAKDEKAVEI